MNAQTALTPYAAEYRRSPGLQAEFGSEGAYVAYRRAEARGAARVLRGTVQSYRAPAPEVSVPGAGTRPAAAPQQPEARDPYAAEYWRSTELQAEFRSVGAYSAYCRARDRGLVRMRNDPAVPTAQPANDAAEEPEPAAAGTTVGFRPRRASAFDLLAGQPWAMLPSMLDTMMAISQRENEQVEVLEARLGKPLQNAQSVSVRDGVAIVPVVGPIFRFANIFSRVSGATSLDVLATDFTQALDDPAVKAIVLNLNTPGGMASGISEFATMVRRAGKPVVAFVERAASGGYWIASAAHQVVVGRTGEAGSVGAVVSLDTRKPDGMVEIVSSQSPRKRPDVATDEGRAQIQAHVDRWAQAFIEDVATGRKVTTDTVLARFGQGDMLMGRYAVAAGMADRVATLEEVIADLAANPSIPRS